MDYLLVRTLVGALQEVTRQPAVVGRFPAFTVAALLQTAGTPVIVCGPAAVAAAHADDEHVLTAELHAAVRIYLRLALRLCEAEWRAAHV